MTTLAPGIAELERELVDMVRAQFDSPEFKRFLSAPFTQRGAQILVQQRTLFVKNRRDCWGYVSGAAPVEVKRLIWEHEQDELMGDFRAEGTDHVTLSVQEGAKFGLSAEEVNAAEPTPVSLACFYAWIHLAKDRPWLEGLTASSILEWTVSDDIVPGGGVVRRLGERLHQDLGVPLKEQASNAVHVVADLEHATMLNKVIRQYVRTEADAAAVRRAARESLMIERAFRGHIGDLVAAAAAGA